MVIKLYSIADSQISNHANREGNGNKNQAKESRDGGAKITISNTAGYPNSKFSYKPIDFSERPFFDR